MFRELRRKKNAIDIPTVKALLQSSRRGVLAVNGDDGYPYAVPINYFYDEPTQKIYFHGARAGHKFDALQACDKVCFTVYGNETVKDATWAPYLQSAVVFGRCHLVEDGPRAMELLKKVASASSGILFSPLRCPRMICFTPLSASCTTASAQASLLR